MSIVWKHRCKTLSIPTLFMDHSKQFPTLFWKMIRTQVLSKEVFSSFLLNQPTLDNVTCIRYILRTQNEWCHLWVSNIVYHNRIPIELQRHRHVWWHGDRLPPNFDRSFNPISILGEGADYTHHRLVLSKFWKRLACLNWGRQYCKPHLTSLNLCCSM